MKDFGSTTETRPVEDLLEIIGDKNAADNQACKEIYTSRRNQLGRQSTHHLIGDEASLQKLKKAAESYTLLDFLLDPIATTFDVLTSFGLEEEGYLNKAKQQKTLRPIFFLILFLMMATVILS